MRASIGQWDEDSSRPINGSTVNFITRSRTSEQPCDILPFYRPVIPENPLHIAPTKWLNVSQLT